MKTMRYNGTACLNLRSVDAAYETFLNTRRGEPMSARELMSVLALLETMVTSKALVFDGTVPQEFLDKALPRIEVIHAKTGVSKLQAEPVAPLNDEDWLEAIRVAADAIALHLEHLDPLEIADRPLPPGAGAQILERLHWLRTAPTEDTSVAGDEARSRYLGSKLVAGIYLSGPEALENAAGVLTAQGEADLDRRAAALVNRFRLAYVNHLAAQRQGVYLPDHNLEAVSAQNSDLFQRFVLKEMTAHNAEWKVLRESLPALDDRIEIPPLGLYALMRVTAHDPIELLAATQDRMKGYDTLFREMWRTSQKAMREHGRRSTGTSGLEDYHAEVTDFFEAELGALESRQALSSSRAGMRRYVTLGAGAIFKGFIGGGVASALTELVARVAENGFGDGLDHLAKHGFESHVTQYSKLSQHLAGRLPREAQKGLHKRVERVFGRPLVWDSGDAIR